MYSPTCKNKFSNQKVIRYNNKMILHVSVLYNAIGCDADINILHGDVLFSVALDKV